MFQIRQRGSTVWREVLGGCTTFMAMSYIIFVQIGVLGSPHGANMDPGGVMIATCLAAGFASILMGVLANYPIALAPGMGQNFFFAFTLVPAIGRWGLGLKWEVALAMTGVAGLIFLLLSFVGFRSYIADAIPGALKNGIAAGIGLFIAVIGFSDGNLAVSGGGLVTFPGFRENPAALLTLFGLAIMLFLVAIRMPGAILIGIIVNAVAAGLLGYVEWPEKMIQWPGGALYTMKGFLKGFVGLGQALWSKNVLEVLVFLFILLFMDLFDTIGTLVGVANRAGLMKDGKLPKAERALAADAAGTVVGAALGTSTVTSYIESVTGVAAGARTGLAAIVAGLLMAAAVFFGPVALSIGGGIEVTQTLIIEGKPLVVTAHKFPMIAPALILVGSMMLGVMRNIDWDDVTESLPAFLTMVTIPLAYSISAGIAMGFVAYAFAKIVSGRFRQCPIVVTVFAVLFVVQYVLKAIYGLA